LEWIHQLGLVREHTERWSDLTRVYYGMGRQV
jgi:hypothetical protein